MTNELEVFHKILFLELRPWVNKDVSEIKYKDLLQKSSSQIFTYQPLYKLDFIKPLTSKRKYYYNLIDNEAIRFLNTFYVNISGALNESEKKYWVHTTLTKTLTQKLKEVSKVINDNQYFYDLLVPSTSTKNTDAKTIDETYIIQFLKYQLLRIYSEIQENYKAHLKDEPLTEAELQQLYFSENIPASSFIKEADKIKVSNASNAKTIVIAEATFNKLTNDFREFKKGIFSYQTVIKNPTKFAQFEEQLFVNKYIDSNYNFIAAHGKISKLACIYHILKSKGYFNPVNFEKSNKKLEQVDIRKFLDHRYNASTDKQFRSLNTQNVSDFQTLEFWLDRLPTC